MKIVTNLLVIIRELLSAVNLKQPHDAVVLGTALLMWKNRRWYETGCVNRSSLPGGNQYSINTQAF